MVEKKTILLASAAVVPATLGISLVYYMKKKAQRLVTVTLSPTDIKICTDWQTISIAVTDGFGKPAANETVTISAYLDGVQAGSPQDFTLGADGTLSLRVCWYYNPAAPVSHVDADKKHLLTYRVTCKGNYTEANGSLTEPTCTDIPGSCPGSCTTS
jgi:hypothetical protein